MLWKNNTSLSEDLTKSNLQMEVGKKIVFSLRASMGELGGRN